MSHADPAGPHVGAPDPGPETFGAAELLADLPVLAEDAAALQGVRLTAAVAAALRATLDWLTGELGPSRPLRARADDAALEIVLERVDGRGLRAAGEVLAVVGGSLGRVESARPEAPWVARVPIHGEREQYLMVIEAGLPVAFPWPAVLHIVMAHADELAAGLSAPLVPALVPDLARTADEIAPGGAEVPVVLLGLGLKRGYYVAERLVWRLSAVTIETDTPPPAPGLTRAVQSEEGDCYWVADPAWLLHAVDEPALDLAPPAERTPPPQMAPVLGEADVHPIGLPPPAVEPMGVGAPPPERPPVAAPPPAPIVEPGPPAPIVEPGPPAPMVEPGPPAPAAEAHPPASAAEAVPPRPAAGATFRAALVAEDSLTASIFLARLLEQQGFIVRTVVSALELGRELARGDWALVCVDVELPDGRGREHLIAARSALERAHAGRPVLPALVALVRDPEDVAEAQAAGITRVLRKPFDRGALEQLLGRIGIAAGGAS